MGLKIWLPAIRAKSGADVYVTRLANELSRRGHQPTVEWFPHYYQYAPWLLRKAAPPTGTQLVHSNSWYAFAFKRTGIPLVSVVLHCVYRRGFPEWKSASQAIFHDHFVGRFERWSFSMSDHVLAISSSTEAEVVADFGVRNISTIPLWVDTDAFRPTVDADCTTDEPRTRVLIVGNMGKRKGGDLISRFCEKLGPKFAVTVIAGLRGVPPQVSAHGAELTIISGLSESDLIKYYQSTDIVASLSRHEGFGYTALEAMSCGKPVVSFDVSGLRDVVANGVCGFLVPKEDITSMAETCRNLSLDPMLRQRLGQNGRAIAQTAFGADTAVDAHLRLYNRLVESSIQK